MKFFSRKKTLVFLCSCAAVLSVVLLKCTVAYECVVEFTYADTRLRPGDKWVDAEHFRRLMSGAGDCFAQLTSELNLQKLADKYMHEAGVKQGNSQEVHSVLSGMQFAVIERSETNSAIRCSISLKSKKRDPLQEMVKLCLDSYKHFVESENTSMLDKAVYREHIEWAKCKRRIDELEREALTGKDVSLALATERKRLALLASEEEKARERAKERGMRTVTDEVVTLSFPQLVWE